MHTLPVLDKKNIEGLIPQRHPFVMVDSLLDFSETGLSAGYTVPADAVFSANNNFLESGLLEHQAQSVALHTGYKFFLKGEVPPTGYIGAVKYFSLIRLPQCGEKIITKIEILAEMNDVTLVKTESKIDDEIIGTSEMKTVLA